MTLDLTDDEKLAFGALLTRGRKMLLVRCLSVSSTLKAVLAKIEPPPAVAQLRPDLECGADANLVAHPASPRRPPELPESSDRVLTYRIETQINPTAARVRPGRRHQPLG
jgi:hypothetical protein